MDWNGDYHRRRDLGREDGGKSFKIFKYQKPIIYLKRAGEQAMEKRKVLRKNLRSKVVMRGKNFRIINM